jgi:hypothetical protein
MSNIIVISPGHMKTQKANMNKMSHDQLQNSAKNTNNP